MHVAHPKNKAELLEAFGCRRLVRVLISTPEKPLASSVIGVIRSLRYEEESEARFGAVIVEVQTREIWDGSLGVFQ